MDQADRTAYVRTGIMYLIIAIVLLAAIVLGVRWAKTRSEHYANNPAGESSQEQTPEEQTPPDVAGEATQSPAESSSSETPSTPTAATESQDHAIPSTGPADTLFVLGAMGLATFAFGKYIQARRKLLTLS